MTDFVEKRLVVCEVVCDLTNGGVESVLLNYFSHIDRSVLDLHLMTYGVASEVCRKSFEDLGFAVHEVVPKRKGFIKSCTDMRRTISSIAPDVLHAHLTDWNALPLFFARGCGVPVRIAHSHMAKLETPAPLHALLSWAVKKCATCLAACGEDAAKNMYGNDARNAIVLHNAIDLKEFSFDDEARASLRRDNCLENRTVIGHIGRFMDQKNHLFLLDAFEEFFCKNPEKKPILLLFGAGDTREVQEWIAAHNAADRVRLMGVTSEMSRWYSAFDLFVLPSKYEGLPVSAIEAQANGLPVCLSSIITREVCLREGVFYIGIERSSDWADGMAAALSYGRNAADLSGSKYDITTQADSLMCLYQGGLL